MLTTAARLAIPLICFGLAAAKQFNPLPLPPSGQTVLGFSLGGSRGMLRYGPQGISEFNSVNYALPDSDVTNIQPWSGTEGAFLVVHSDGRLDKLTLKPANAAMFSLQLTAMGHKGPGDRMVAGSWLISWSAYEGAPYASADGITWTPFSVGGDAQLSDVTFDIQGHALALDRSGRVWRQAALHQAWELLSEHQGLMGHAIYAHQGAVYASFLSPVFDGGPYPGLTLRSTDEGATWKPDTAGLGWEAADRFFDNGNKEVTLVTQDGSRIFTRPLMGSKWAREDQALADFLKLFPGTSPAYTGFFKQPYTAYASSPYGVFQRVDGAWHEWDADGLGKEPIQDLAFEADGTMWAGTNRGLYRYSVPKAGDSDPAYAWKRVSYAVKDVTIDKHGVFHSGFSRSEDRGVTWIRDPESEGRFRPIPIFSAGRYLEAATSFVDEDGNTYAAKRDDDSINVYARPRGGEWKPTGLSIAKRGVPVMTEDFFASDGKGGVYYGLFNIDVKGLLWKGSATGSWVPDTAGMGGRMINATTADGQGRLLAATADGVFRRESTGWKPLTYAHPLSATSLSVDAAGNVCAVSEGMQLYLWKDGDANWEDVDVSGVSGESFNKVIAHGDKTYALAAAHAFVLDAPTAVRSLARARGGDALRLSAGKILLPIDGITRVLDMRGRTLPESITNH